jgi:hypothetical protein
VINVKNPGRGFTDPRGGKVLEDLPRGGDILHQPGRGYSNPRGGKVLEDIPRGGDILHHIPRGG